MITIIIVLVILSFSFVIFFGAPYLPTFRRETQTALDLLNLEKGQTLFELGCGDGRVLIAAAQRDLKVVGYELNPLLALVAWLRTRHYGRRVRVRWGNFWRADISEADGVFVFLLNKYMAKLDKKMLENTSKPRRLVSYAFQIPGKKLAKTKGALYLYKY